MSLGGKLGLLAAGKSSATARALSTGTGTAAGRRRLALGLLGGQCLPY